MTFHFICTCHRIWIEIHMAQSHEPVQNSQKILPKYFFQDNSIQSRTRCPDDNFRRVHPDDFTIEVDLTEESDRSPYRTPDLNKDHRRSKESVPNATKNHAPAKPAVLQCKWVQKCAKDSKKQLEDWKLSNLAAILAATKKPLSKAARVNKDLSAKLQAQWTSWWTLKEFYLEIGTLKN